MKSNYSYFIRKKGRYFQLILRYKDNAGQWKQKTKSGYKNKRDITGEEKEALIQVIANNMKKSYNVYNKEHVQDEVIFRHLRELSQDRLNLTGIESLDKSKIYYSSNKNAKNNNKNQNKRRSHHTQKNRHK